MNVVLSGISRREARGTEFQLLIRYYRQIVRHRQVEQMRQRRRLLKMLRIGMVESWQMLMAVRVNVNWRHVILIHTLLIRSMQIVEARFRMMLLMRGEKQRLVTLVVEEVVEEVALVRIGDLRGGWIVEEHLRMMTWAALALMWVHQLLAAGIVRMKHLTLWPFQVGVIEAGPALPRRLLVAIWHLPACHRLRPLLIENLRLMSTMSFLSLRSIRMLFDVAGTNYDLLLSLWLHGPVTRALLSHLLHEPLLVSKQRLNLQHLLRCDRIQRASSITALIRCLGLIQIICLLSKRSLLAMLVDAELALVESITWQWATRSLCVLIDWHSAILFLHVGLASLVPLHPSLVSVIRCHLHLHALVVVHVGVCTSQDHLLRHDVHIWIKLLSVLLGHSSTISATIVIIAGIVVHNRRSINAADFSTVRPLPLKKEAWMLQLNHRPVVLP